MNTVEGTVSDIRRQAVDGGSRTSFRLHSADGTETQVETRLDFPYNNGDVVRASGEIDSDLILAAASIAQVRQTSPSKPFPWLWALAAFALLAVGYVGYRLLSGSSSPGSTLTVTAMNCGKVSAGSKLTLRRPNGTTTLCNGTAANGTCEFPTLPKGAYTVSRANVSLPVIMDGKTPQSVTFVIEPPMGPGCFIIVHPPLPIPHISPTFKN